MLSRKHFGVNESKNKRMKSYLKKIDFLGSIFKSPHWNMFFTDEIIKDCIFHGNLFSRYRTYEMVLIVYFRKNRKYKAI